MAPLAINRVFCEFPDLGRERRGLVAIGRWDDPQKNAPLLARALRRYLDARVTRAMRPSTSSDPAGTSTSGTSAGGTRT